MADSIWLLWQIAYGLWQMANSLWLIVESESKNKQTPNSRLRDYRLMGIG
ncbi:hypothetical protein [Candidatus Oleimmundimicrobium sp.]|nr:hypothetical protein [Candidatus Oleimmundimicrobium sp.]MDO8886395.1 hypothetical protein [Candidatus Oleimmundimicrobium sp.]